MKNRINLFTVLLCCGFASCSKQTPVDIGNGFYLRGEGMTLEGHPSAVSLYIEKNGTLNRIWSALSAGHGGPYLIDDGVLFCARNQKDEVSVFAANGKGDVAEIMPFLSHKSTGARSVRQVRSLGNQIQFELSDEQGANATLSVSRTDLIQLVNARVKVGVKVTWGKLTFYK